MILLCCLSHSAGLGVKGPGVQMHESTDTGDELRVEVRQGLLFTHQVDRYVLTKGPDLGDDRSGTAGLFHVDHD